MYGSRKYFNRLAGAFFSAALIALILAHTSFAQGGVDENFKPLITNSSGAGPSTESLQPDGKLIVTGTFSIVNDVIRSNIIRVNTDGSIDPSFNCTVCTFNLTNTLVQPDGKILVAGSNSSTSRAVLIRLNPDGSRDNGFADPFATLVGSGERYGTVYAVQSDGKIYATVFSNGPQLASRIIYRVNTDGTIDGGFTAITINERPGSGQSLGGITVKADGRVYIYGNTPYGYLARLNSDGTKDTSFEAPALTYPPGNSPIQPIRPHVNSFGEQSDGKILITGRFDSVNAIPLNSVARLNVNGSVDTGYSPQPAFTSQSNRIIKVYPSDSTLFVRYDTAKKIVLIKPDGTVDLSYSAPDELTNVWRTLLLAGDKLLVYGEYNGVIKYIRLNFDGSLDTSFTSPTFQREGSVTKIAIGADGKATIYGGFNTVNGVARPGIARLNPDGTLDTAFAPTGTGFDGAVSALAVQPDGKVIASGGFNNYNGGPDMGIIRLNSDGSVDTGFNPSILPIGAATEVVVRPDGKILIAGTINFVSSTARTKIALLNSDGSLDGAFNPLLGGTTPQVNTLYLQADGKIMVGGIFSGVNGFSRSGLVRLNSDGTLDTAFNGGSLSFVADVFQLTDGKYLIQMGNGGLSRLLSTGAIDNTFAPLSTSYLYAIQPLANGTTLIGGTFTSINGSPRNYLARLNSSGGVDTLFSPSGTNKPVRAMALQADGKVFVGGEFTQIGGVDRTNLARISGSESVVRPTPFDFDGDGRADPSVTRPGTDFWWYQLTGPSYNYSGGIFGQAGDKSVPADYDGDGKTDIAVWRPSDGYWWYKSSRDGLAYALRLGAPNDIPLPQDVTGDGKAEIVVVRNYAWYAATTEGQYLTPVNFGQAGDKPVIGDFDGDGKSDYALFRPSTGNWIYRASSNGGAQVTVHFGISTDIPVPADYDGDGKTDMAVYRPSEGNWYVLYSGGGFLAVHFGIAEDRPIAADYDGDGKADIAVFRPSEGFWYELLTTGGYTGYPWGTNGDVPTPAAYVTFASLPRPAASTTLRK